MDKPLNGFQIELFQEPLKKYLEVSANIAPILNRNLLQNFYFKVYLHANNDQGPIIGKIEATVKEFKEAMKILLENFDNAPVEFLEKMLAICEIKDPDNANLYNLIDEIFDQFNADHATKPVYVHTFKCVLSYESLKNYSNEIAIISQELNKEAKINTLEKNLNQLKVKEFVTKITAFQNDYLQGDANKQAFMKSIIKSLLANIKLKEFVKTLDATVIQNMIESADIIVDPSVQFKVTIEEINKLNEVMLFQQQFFRSKSFKDGYQSIIENIEKQKNMEEMVGSCGNNLENLITFKDSIHDEELVKKKVQKIIEESVITIKFLANKQQFVAEIHVKNPKAKENEIIKLSELNILHGKVLFYISQLKNRAPGDKDLVLKEQQKLEDQFVKFGQLAKTIKEVVLQLNELVNSGYDLIRDIEMLKEKLFDCKKGEYFDLERFNNDNISLKKER